MAEPSSTPDSSPVLETVEQRLVASKDITRFTGNNLSPEIKAGIEERLRRGVAITKIARELQCSPSTVLSLRDRLTEEKPELFKASVGASLQRVAKRGVDVLEKAFDAMAEDPEALKPSQVAGVSVALGIVLDKVAQLSGDQQVQVVEHRLKIDAGTVSELLGRANTPKMVEKVDENAIELSGEVVDVTPLTP